MNTTVRRRNAVISLAIFLVVAFATCRQQSDSANKPPGQYNVSRVIDGDTIYVQRGTTELKVRLIGIDTPETHGRGGLRECFGEEASDFTTSYLKVGSAVQLQLDAQEFDRYGRTLAYVYRTSDNSFVNMELAKLGYATDLSISPNTKYANQFATVVENARANRLGLWGACGGPDLKLD